MRLVDGTEDKCITSAAIRRKFDICNNTLRNWDEGGRHSTVKLGGDNGKRLNKMCDVERAFVGYRPTTDASRVHKEVIKAKVCYARVSSQKQRPDLTPVHMLC